MGDLVFQRKHTMAQRTLFSVLLRQPWWTSAMVGVVLFGLTQLAYPPIAPFVGLPFLFIALYVAYRQWRTLSPEKINKRLEKITQMNWSSFSTLICAAYRRQGYEVVAVKKIVMISNCYSKVVSLYSNADAGKAIEWEVLLSKS